METPAAKLDETYRNLKPLPGARRKRVRHKIHTPAYASLNTNSVGVAVDLNEILDISEDGISIQTSPPPALQQSVNLCLDLSETKAYIYTTGYVVWTDSSGRAGIRFPNLAETSRRQLREWLFLNAITACANRIATSSSPESEAVIRRLDDRSEYESADAEPAPPSDFTSVLAGLEAVNREVIAVGTDLDTALQLIADRAQSFTRASGAAIALSQGQEMVCVASAGLDAPPLGARLHVGSGFSGECARTGTLQHCDDSENDPRVDASTCRALGVRSMVAVPIRMGEQVMGLMEVFSPAAHTFNSSDDAVLQHLCETVLSAVNRATQVVPPANNEMATAEVSSEIFDQPSSWAWLHRAILVAAAATLAFALLWFLIPRSRVQPASASAPPTEKELAPTTVAVTSAPTDLQGLTRLAEQGDATAQFAVGARYATAEGVPQDYAEAIRWFTMAAEQGHVNSQAMLGAYYHVGRGVPQDLPKAYFWSILAQAGGDEASKYRIPLLVSQMSRGQVLEAQRNANDWIREHRLAKNSPVPLHQ